MEDATVVESDTSAMWLPPSHSMVTSLPPPLPSWSRLEPLFPTVALKFFRILGLRSLYLLVTHIQSVTGSETRGV